MLTVVDFGAAPTNLTTPLRVAVRTVMVLLTEAGGPAFTAFRLEMQIIAVRASIGMSLFVVFVVMQTTFCGRGGPDFLFWIVPSMRVRAGERGGGHSPAILSSFCGA